MGADRADLHPTRAAEETPGRSRWTRPVRDPAVRIAAGFLFFGVAWILASDRALEVLVRDVNRLSALQTYKGWLFVAATAVLLYVVVRREFHARLAAERGRLEMRRREISAREGAVAAERRASRILESVAEAFYALDRDWRFTYLNGNAERYFGRPRGELIGRRIWDLFPESVGSVFFRRYREALRRGERVTFEAQSVVSPDRWLEVRVYPTRAGLAIYTTDVTERRTLEAKLRHAQKMEAVGRLAGGLAHDVRNVLNVVTGNARFLLDDLDDGDPCRAFADEILRSAERGSKLAGRLLVFSRKEERRPGRLRLNAAIRDAVGMLRAAVGKAVELRLGLDPADPAVEADPGDLDQALLNLAVNAKDAMPDGGTLTLTTATATIREAGSRRFAGDIAPGDYVLLSVEDTGRGMDEPTRERIFDPFFTTKAEGQGTGLGLSAVYGIVQRFGGAIDVESRVGEGTRFRIWVPVAS